MTDLGQPAAKCICGEWHWGEGPMTDEMDLRASVREAGFDPIPGEVTISGQSPSDEWLKVEVLARSWYETAENPVKPWEEQTEHVRDKWRAHAERALANMRLLSTGRFDGL